MSVQLTSAVSGGRPNTPGLSSLPLPANLKKNRVMQYLLHTSIIGLSAIGFAVACWLVFLSFKKKKMILHATIPLAIGMALEAVSKVFLAATGWPREHTVQAEVTMNIGRACLLYGIIVGFVILGLDRLASRRSLHK